MPSAAAEAIAAKHNAGIGHNSSPDVKSYVNRLVALETEKKTLAEDIRELKAEAKDKGLVPRALAAAAKLEMEGAEQRAKRVAFEETLDTYKAALGLLD